MNEINGSNMWDGWHQDSKNGSDEVKSLGIEVMEEIVQISLKLHGLIQLWIKKLQEIKKRWFYK